MLDKKTIAQGLELIRKSNANHDYFFEQLSSPEWLDPLREADLFREAPAAERVGNGVSFPMWAESMYLTRMAASAPDNVLQIMEAIPETDNVRVHADLAEAAAQMPGPLAARWSKRERPWIDKQATLYFLLPDAYAKLGVHLAASGQCEEAIELARSLLRLIRDERRSHEVRGLFEEWEYGQVVKSLRPVMTTSCGIAALDVLCETLATSFSGGTSDEDDGHSWIWRPAIEPHAQNHDQLGDVRNILIDAIRDTAADLIVGNAAKVLATLRRYRPLVFRRLELDLLAKHHAVLQHEAAAVALHDAYRLAPGTYHEYSRFIGAAFPGMVPDIQDAVLKWIDAGPGLDGRDVAKEDAERFATSWKVRRLAPIQDALPAPWRQKFEDLTKIVPVPEHPDFLSYHFSSTGGPASPKTGAELDALGAKAVAAFLQEWQPAHDWHAPSREGLARELQAAVARAPEQYGAALELCSKVHPTYARVLISGFGDALKQGLALPWDQILAFLAVVVAKPRAAADHALKYSLDEDPHWGWARQAAVHLIAQGLDGNKFLPAQRARIWHVVLTVTDDPEPAPEDKDDSLDALTRSINTPRGEAMHTVVRYALWLSRAGPAKARDRSFSEMPEVRDLLDKRLDPAVEPSPAIRAVYGQWLPALTHLDRGWVEEQLERIFPAEPELAHLRDAAWMAYIVSSPVYDNVVALLQQEYSRAIDRAAVTTKAGSWLADPNEKLGEHLMVLVGRGRITYGGADGLCERFFARASDPITAQTISFVGRSLHEEKPALPPEVRARFMAFWDALMPVLIAAKPKRDATLKAFGIWFGWGHFDELWSLQQLETVAREVGGAEPDSIVLEKLATIAGRSPETTLRILDLLVRGAQQPWEIHGWTQDATTILKAALADTSTADDAEKLLHYLGARGFRAYRALHAK